jgi:hypothetical protein
MFVYANAQIYAPKSAQSDLGCPNARAISNKHATLSRLPVRGENFLRGFVAVELKRLFGYEIEPQRTVPDDLFNEPLGGGLAVGESLRIALDNSLKAAEKSKKMSEVVLRVDEDPEHERTCPARDAVLKVTFDEDEEAAAAAAWLASQLSHAMDQRSKECLLLIAAYWEDRKPKRRMAAWIFPQDEAFRFTPGEDGNDIELLTEVFSRTSAYRKMAVFEGKNWRRTSSPPRFSTFNSVGRTTSQISGSKIFWKRDCRSRPRPERSSWPML